MQGKGPYILITSLLLVLFFIGGVRYGQKVEKTNNKVSELLSVTPKQIPKEFKNYKNKDCSLDFSYPANLKISKETTSSAEFRFKNKPIFDFSCDATTESNIKIFTFQE